MKVFLINLDRDAERLASMSSQLDRLGILWERVPAVDGRAMSISEVDAVYDEALAIATIGIPLTRGHIGCSLSHARLYERIVHEEIERCLVLEDDMDLSPDIVRVLNEWWVNQNFWDYVHLSYTPMSLLWVRSWFRSSWWNIKRNPLFALYALIKLPYVLALAVFEVIRQHICAHNIPKPVRFFRPLYHTGAYLVTLEGARKMLSMAYPIRFSADQLVNRARFHAGLRLYGYCPPPARPIGTFGSHTAAL